MQNRFFLSNEQWFMAQRNLLLFVFSMSKLFLCKILKFVFHISRPLFCNAYEDSCALLETSPTHFFRASLSAFFVVKIFFRLIIWINWYVFETLILVLLVFLRKKFVQFMFFPESLSRSHLSKGYLRSFVLFLGLSSSLSKKGSRKTSFSISFTSLGVRPISGTISGTISD